MEDSKKILRGLDPTTYEHEFDRKALAKMRDISGLEKVLNFITKHAVEKVYSIQYTGSHLRVTADTYPKIYSYLEKACNILDLKKNPELYIKWDYTIDANTVGNENPIVILNSGLLDLCNDDEIMFLLGHELGHIKSKHMLYHMTGEVMGFFLDFIPLIGKAGEVGICYWDRMSDLTADRAGLLCCQNKDAMISALMKMAGVPIKEYTKLQTSTFIQQALNFQGMRDLSSEEGDTETSLMEKASIAFSKEPWTVMRASELLKWIDSGEYNKYIN